MTFGIFLCLFLNCLDDVINIKKNKMTVTLYIRDNELVRVYVGGKYIQFAFYLPKDAFRELTSYPINEKVGEKYREMDGMQMNDENDRLGLSRKTPDYKEAKDKETKLEE
ncbi:cystatin-like fold lipoprotein [Bacillus subtilis]|uniref:cystatin-like fold lipoprotein n=1 Tax=Bacillus subtilis TaxID=1423 RepID=UPI002DB8BA00|nr:cystatin-like fold lipoprotein [Bacillus subtilis]MEC3621112.1 cystatin-like fold lipoprotein [Bacillus subtilis]MEC3698652.1 cystatin-like fold lipoprotein [Bacillus subtilis]MEC3845890.1 cystatin-like fold lipoprotein [Bacillus subtilis]